MHSPGDWQSLRSNKGLVVRGFQGGYNMVGFRGVRSFSVSGSSVYSV